MARILVEQTFDPPMAQDQYDKIARRLDPCIELRDVLWRRSYVSQDRRRMMCEFEAPDAEAVREAFRSAGMPFERAWLAEVSAIEDYPEWMEKLRALQARLAARTR
jgi:hypothetical protein